MTASEHSLGELWYKDTNTGMSTSFTAASTFVATATKLRFWDFDASEAVQESYPDRAVQTNPDKKPADRPGRRKGSFKFKVYLEGGSSSTSPGTVAALLGCGLGGIKNPPRATDTNDSASATSAQIYCNAHGLYHNDMVLVGTDADGKGGGKIGVVSDNSEANSFPLEMALPGTPASGDALKFGHTVWLNWLATQEYQDFLFIGAHEGTGATDDPDSIQFIGCGLAGVAFGGFAEGEPWVELTYNAAQWQWVSYANQATFAYATAASGGDPPAGDDAGALCLQDASSTTRNTITGADISIELPFQLRMIQDHNYVNDCGGWKKVPNPPGEGPALVAKPYFGDLADMPGIYNDFQNSTAKQALYQMGNVSQGTVAFYMSRCFVKPVDPSKRVDAEDLTALELRLVGDSPSATDLSDDFDRQRDAAMVISFN